MRLRLLVAILAVVPSLVFAQTRKVEDKKAITYNEIERGLFLGVNGGLWSVINPPAGQGSTQPFLLGQGVQVELGYDIGDRISPAVMFIAAATSGAGSDYLGLSGGQASGDYSALIPGGTIKVRLLGVNDAQGVTRGWLYARGNAGYVFYSPGKLLNDASDVLIGAGGGFEYFTRLRHFSIGAEGTFNFMALTGTMGFSAVVSVRYAFPSS